MAKDDYKKQKHVKQHGGAIRHVVGLLASFLLGYLVANVVDLPSLIAWFNQYWPDSQRIVRNDKVHVTRVSSAKASHRPKPKFEFYTLLSKDNHALPAAAIRDARLEAQSVVSNPALQSTGVTAQANKGLVQVTERQSVPFTEPSALKPTSQETYMIQVAAVTRRQDAERLKASLTLKGYNVMIVSPTEANINWYRVVIGPYHSRAEAEKAQVSVARTEHIQGMIRKIDV